MTYQIANGLNNAGKIFLGIAEPKTCSFCEPSEENEYYDDEELREHEDHFHGYEVHDRDCSAFDVVDMKNGEAICRNCGVKWSKE